MQFGFGHSTSWTHWSSTQKGINTNWWCCCHWRTFEIHTWSLRINPRQRGTPNRNFPSSLLSQSGYYVLVADGWSAVPTNIENPRQNALWFGLQWSFLDNRPVRQPPLMTSEEITGSVPCPIAIFNSYKQCGYYMLMLDGWLPLLTVNVDNPPQNAQRYWLRQNIMDSCLFTLNHQLCT